MLNLLNKVTGFEWDAGNLKKNEIKHAVVWRECEEIFSNQPLIVAEDGKHSSEVERRYKALGVTVQKRCLSVIFTIRNNKIRVISARDANIKERSLL